MRFVELAVFFGIFLMIAFAGVSFISNFGMEEALPSEITSAWNSSQEQIQSAQQSFTYNANLIKQGGLNAVAGVFGLAFSGIFYIIVTVGTVLISIPATIYGGISYTAAQVGIPSSVISMIIGLIGVIVAIAIISFIAGREL